MMAETHIAFGAVLLWLLVIFNIVSGTGSILVAGCLLLIAVLLPDIDTPSSKMGRRFKIIAMLSKHRGWFHSLFAAVLFTIIVNISLNAVFSLIFFAGYLSHLLLDSISIEGTRMFYPSRIILNGRIKVGGLIERFISLILIVASVVLLYSAVA